MTPGSTANVFPGRRLEFGYEGSGAQQQSLSILADVLGDFEALALRREFAHQIVSNFQGAAAAFPPNPSMTGRGTKSRNS